MNGLATVRDVQARYFELLESHLSEERGSFQGAGFPVDDPTGDAFREWLTSNLLPRLAGPVLATPQGSMSVLLHRVVAMLLDVRRFWDEQAARLLEASQASDAYSCLVGDVPLGRAGLEIRRHAMYFDTVYVRDPLAVWSLRRLFLGQPLDPIQFGGRTLAFYFALLACKRLFVNHSEYPIAVVYPYQQVPDVEEVTVRGEEVRNYVNELLDLRCADYEEAETVFRSAPLWEMHNRLRARAPLFCEAVEQPVKRFSQAVAEADFEALLRRHYVVGLADHPVDALPGASGILSTLMRTLGHIDAKVVHANALRAQPALDKLSWEAFRWRLSRDAARAATAEGQRAEIGALRALGLPQIDWLGNASIEDLVSLRERGEMEGMRTLFRVGHRRLRAAAPLDFDSVAQEVVTTLEAAVQEYRDEWQQKQKAFTRETKLTGGRVFLGIGLTVVGALYPGFAWITTAGGLALGGSLRDLTEKRREEAAMKSAYGRGPLGILLRAKHGNDSSQGVDSVRQET